METLEITDLKDMLKKTENFGNKPAYKIRQGEGKYKIITHKEVREMNDDGVQIHFIGRIWELSPLLQKKIHEAEDLMKDNTGVKFIVAVNYGGQDEMTRAVQNIAKRVKDGEIDVDSINNEVIESSLDTAGLPPVDFMIRTSGDLRLSNFLLWQAAYAEFWFTDVNWPDFSPQHFMEALCDFTKRKRRFGGLKNE